MTSAMTAVESSQTRILGNVCPTQMYGAPACGFQLLSREYPTATRSIPTPATTTARGDASPANNKSRASVKATVLEGATHATEATQSPARLTVLASRV